MVVFVLNVSTGRAFLVHRRIVVTEANAPVRQTQGRGRAQYVNSGAQAHVRVTSALAANLGQWTYTVGYLSE